MEVTGKLSSCDLYFVTDEEISFLKVMCGIHTLKLMKFLFKCCTVSMKFVVVLRFFGFMCVIHLSGKSLFIKFLNHCLKADCRENGI